MDGLIKYIKKTTEFARSQNDEEKFGVTAELKMKTFKRKQKHQKGNYRIKKRNQISKQRA